MVSLLGALLGFLGSMMPEIIKIFKDKSDKRHELDILDRQLSQKNQEGANQLQVIGNWADVEEMRVLHQNFRSEIRWVEALNGSVRPVLAYAFFVLYAGVKIIHATHLPWLLWTEEDQAIFAGIVSFYFGQRAMMKSRDRI